MNADISPEQQQLKTLSLLYVEDDHDARAQFSIFLSRSVGTLIIATNGNEGLEAFRNHAPDIVLTDIIMPKMDGLSMAGEIRRIAPSVPIIAITAFDEVDYLMRAITLGIDKFVFKPVRGNNLLECLHECVRRMGTGEHTWLDSMKETDDEQAGQNGISALIAGAVVEQYDRVSHDLSACASLAKHEAESAGVNFDFHLEMEKCYKEAYELGEMFKILGIDFSEKLQHGQVAPVIQSSIEEAISGRSVDFSIDLPENLPEISFIVHLVQLVFSGLAHNAAEAMPSGGSLNLAIESIEIHEQESTPLRPGGYIRCTLSDTGTGIPEDLLPKIFTPYFTTKKGSGSSRTGLTLALCRIIIVNMGGIITAESTPGKGSLFRVWLPASARKL